MPLFNRVASVTIGQVGEESLKLSGLRISFNIVKTEDKDPNSAEVEIYNLSEDTRNKIRDTGKFILINAGYINGAGEEIIFAGDISFVSHEVRRPEIITKIEAQDGKKKLDSTVFETSNDSGVSARTILERILESFDLSSNIRNISISDKNYANGFSFIGLSKDALTRVTEFLNLSWSIQNNEVILVPFDKSDNTRVVSLNPQTGLVGSPERLKGSTRKAKKLSEEDKPGWRFTSLLLPRVNPLNRISVSSREIPSNSIFTVFSVNHTGDTHGSDWNTVVEVRE